MGGGQDVALNEPLPEWASGLAHGDYRIVGAALPTRDGRNHGNATLILWETPSERGDIPVALLRTEAGNEMRMTEREIKESFWPPVWVKRLPTLSVVSSLRALAIIPTMAPGVQKVVLNGHRCRVCATVWRLSQPEHHADWCTLKGTE